MTHVQFLYISGSNDKIETDSQADKKSDKIDTKIERKCDFLHINYNVKDETKTERNIFI